MLKQEVIFRDLGLMAYKPAWEYQEMLLDSNVKIKSSLRQRELAHDDGSLLEGVAESEISLRTSNFFLFVEHHKLENQLERH